MWSAVPSGPLKQFFRSAPPAVGGIIIRNRDEVEPQIISKGAAETLNNSMPKYSKTKLTYHVQLTFFTIWKKFKKYVSKSISMHGCGLNSYESQTG